MNAHERAELIAQARALRDSGDVEGANRLLADGLGRMPAAPPSRPPRPATPETPPLGTLTAREQARAERAQQHGMIIQGSPDAERERLARQVQHTISMLHDTWDNLPEDHPDRVPYPVAPNAPGQSWEGPFGRMLKGAFVADPDLSAAEVAAAITEAVRHARRPLRLTKAGLGQLVTNARRGGPRPVHRMCDMRTNRGNFTVWLGQSTELRDEYGRRDDGTDTSR